MKEEFINAEIELVYFQAVDIITTSDLDDNELPVDSLF